MVEMLERVAVYVLVYVLLVVFGVFYNLVTGWIERNDPGGYTPFLVVGGVLGTLGILAIVWWQVIPWVLLGFACSGLPMVVGSVYRRVQKYKRDRATTLEVLDDVE